MSAQLPLEPTAMLPLRLAYDRSPEIKKRRTFEQATDMKNARAIAILLRLRAEVIARGGK